MNTDKVAICKFENAVKKFKESGASRTGPEAKRIFQKLVRFNTDDLDAVVEKVAKILEVAPQTVVTYMGHANVSKPRVVKHLKFSETQDEIIKKYYTKAKQYTTAEESDAARQELLDELNRERKKEGIELATDNEIGCRARRMGLKWGYKRRTAETKVALSEKARADEQKKQATESLTKAYTSIRSYLKENGRIRNQKATILMGLEKRTSSRDMLEKLTLTQNAKLLGVRNVRGEDGKPTTWYFSAEPGFYNLKTLLHVFPKEECRRIASDALQVIKGGGKHSVSSLASWFYPGQTGDNIVGLLLPELLEESLDLDIITRDSSGNYKTGVFAEFGDPESIRVTHRIGQIITDRLEEKRKDFQTTDEVVVARRKSMEKILTKSLEVGGLLPQKGPINILFTNGLEAGHILAGEEHLDRFLSNLENHPELGPHLIFANRFVQGNFLFSDIMNGLMLDDLSGLDEIDPQIKVAGLFFDRMQRLPGNRALFINTSVDEKRTAKDYALKDMLTGQQWHKVFGLNLSPERQRFVKNKFFFQLFRFQAEVIVPYWLQMSRAPYNNAQMDTLAKERNLAPLGHSEKVALVNLYWAETFGSKERYPQLNEKDQELVCKIRSKYEGWAHWTEQPDPHAKNFNELWAEYSRPVNLYALMGEEAKKFVRQ